MMPGGPRIHCPMSAFSRHLLLAFAVLIPCFGSASALPAPSRRDVPKTKTAANPPAVPDSARHAPIPPLDAKAPYAGPLPVAVAHAVPTPPLLNMKVIPLPRRGDDLEPCEPPPP